MIVLRLQEPGCRLLTLAGPAGIGKTRLAIQAARALWEQDGARFGDGIFLVTVPDAASPDHIVAEIAEAVGLPIHGAADLQQALLHHLREKRLLLILDGAEQLQPQTEIITHILTAATKVKLIVTSRGALNLYGEWFQPVGGMAAPGGAHFKASASRTPLSALQYDAVQLFDLCARRARADFSLQDEECHVVRICQMVQGMPLAIELAAAWLKVLPASSIADEIERGLDFLTSRHQDIPERHRSMRAVLDQTWAMLDDEEQALLQRLAVFQNGFTHQAAASVAGATWIVLAKLVEKALLHMDETRRFEMHELLRQYAGEKLHASGLAEETERAHAIYYLDLLQSLQTNWTGVPQPEILRQIESDQENVRKAWRAMLGRGNWPAIGQALHSLELLHTARPSGLSTPGPRDDKCGQPPQTSLTEMAAELLQEAARTSSMR